MIAMAMLNLYAILRLSPILTKVLNNYNKQRAAGKDPHFTAKSAGVENEAQCWKK
jgi:AGCS family alanine or glycine:cation symporter